MRFVILSLKWSRTSDLAIWWKPNNNGYTTFLEDAGRYTREQVERRPGYYNDGKDTLAIPEDEALGLARRVVVNDASKLLAAHERGSAACDQPV